MSRGRTIPVAALAALAGLALLLALALAYGARAFFDADQFANRASAALEEQAVADEAASRVADELVQADADLIAVRPVLEGVISGIVKGSAFQSLFRSGARDLHRAVFKGDEDTLTLTLVDVGATVRGVLQALQPRLARQIDPRGDASLVDEELPAVTDELARMAEAARWLPLVLLVLGLGAAAGAMRLSPDRRSGVVAVGVALILWAVLAIVVWRAGEALVVGAAESQAARDAVTAIWDAFLGDLRTALLLFAGTGAVIAAAASSLLRPVDVRAQLSRAWELANRVPERPALRALRGAALVGAGILIAVRHEDFLALLAIAVGLYVAYAGVAELMRMTIAGGERAGAARRRGREALVSAGIATAVILAAGAIFIGTGGLAQRSLTVQTEGCNGSEELCDRGFDNVAVPATHNSMSGASYPGWLFAQHDRGIADQLHDGVRGLLIDAHYGVETRDGAIKTDLSDLDRGERETYEQELGSQALDAALRIRDRIVDSPEVGEPGVYLCHRFCELGAIPIDRAFSDLRDFVAANPEEVVTVVIEDYVAPEDVAAAAERTGLLDYVYDGPVGDPWPTLGEMIESGGRVLMLAENDAGGGAIPWYHPAYEMLVQETPYSFGRPAELIAADRLAPSCRPNRGPADASLFLVNHWIDTSPAPRPSNAARVNARDAVLARVHHCERQRDLRANLIAVDFYREGDLFGAVAQLNGERAGP